MVNVVSSLDEDFRDAPGCEADLPPELDLDLPSLVSVAAVSLA